MPELPDVEVFKQYIDATSLHQEIEAVDVRSREMLEDLSAEKLTSRMKGRSLASNRRHGKHLFITVDEDGWLMLHFGMTGNLAYFKDMEKDPPHDRVLFSFTNGYHIIPHRHEGGTCPLCAEDLVRVKASGRSAYLCPKRQRKE